jgi:D-amino-acid dehydrogenase
VAGALQVRGFSLNLHRFGRNLVRLLQAQGARFHWEQSLDELRCDAQGRVSAVVIGGQAQAVHDVVISPGALGSALRGRLAAPAAIGAMAGAWVTLPNDGPALATPLKVRRRGFAGEGAAQGANVVPARDAQGRPVLHCSSGHGFIGVKPGGLKQAALDELVRCAADTAQDLFPDKFERARRAGLLDGPPSVCVRPWTPSGLGLFELQPTAAGGLLVLTGGHNTGGFAQSPEVAEAVAAALDGRTHAMHTLYHPARFDAALRGEAA